MFNKEEYCPEQFNTGAIPKSLMSRGNSLNYQL